MATPQAAWQMINVIAKHPRLKIGVLSIGGCVIFQHILYALWLRWMARRKVAARKLLADNKKKMAREMSDQAIEIDLSSQTAERIARTVKSGNLTAEAILNAFTKKVLDINNRINAVTEPVTEAWEQVKVLDSLDEKNGLLHGVPISIKEHIHIKGYDSTGGMEFFVNKVALDDAVIVKVLKRQGAVPFTRTNNPQAIMSYCSSNPIYGETTNPLDSTRSPGGSSSGEAALIAGGGSIIGVGSDIGGSIRIPANFCGIYSLKPTFGRLSMKGFMSTLSGSLSIRGCPGLMARDYESLLLVSKATMSEDMWTLDPTLPQLPFNQQEFNKTEPLRIGYYIYDGNLQCQPPVVRAVMEAKEALERKGHTLVPINFSKIFKSHYDHENYFIRLMCAESGNTLRNLLANDKVEKSVADYLRISQLPRWLLRIVSLVTMQIDPFLGRSIRGFYGFKSVYEYFNHVGTFSAWKEFFTETWVQHGYDAVICPVFPSPAPKLNLAASLYMAGVYCRLYNSVQYPSGCMPITKVTKEDVSQTLDPNVYGPQNYIEKILLKNVENSEGLPVGIQCVALPFKEEICLRVMRDIDSELKS